MHLKNLNESFDAKYGIDFSDEIDDEELDEGVLDLAKGGINKARSAYNNKKADKAYDKGDFASGKAARDRANQLANQAATNFSDHKNRNDISSRANSRLAGNKELQSNNQEADNEYKAAYQDFIDSARMEFDKSQSVDELNQAYQAYKDELKNSSKTRLRYDDPVMKELQNLYSKYRQGFGYGSQNSGNGPRDYKSFRNAYADDIDKQTTARRNAQYNNLRQTVQSATQNRRNVEQPSAEPSNRGLNGKPPTQSGQRGLGDYDTSFPKANNNSQQSTAAPNNQVSKNSITAEDITDAFSGVMNSFTGNLQDYPKFQTEFMHELNSILADKIRQRN